MVRKGLLFGMALLVALSVATGCSAKNSQQIPEDSGAVKQEITENSAAALEAKQKSIINAFDGLLEKSAALTEIVAFVDQNISTLSGENASIMISRLEEVQIQRLPEMEEKFYSSDIQNTLAAAYSPEFDIKKLNNIEDLQVRTLLTETKDSGYKVETAEGMFFPILDYASYRKYNAHVTPDMKAYIHILAAESDQVPAKDAALVIGWDEVLERALEQEEFIRLYPDSQKIKDMEQLHAKYLTFIFFGTNNTPLFSYDTKTMADDAKNIYLNAVNEDENSKLLAVLKDYLEILKKNDYKLTDEVERFRQTAISLR